MRKQVEDAAVTPARLDQLVKDRATIIAKAKAVIGDKLVVDGKGITEIRRQVVNAKLGDAAKGWNDDQVAASFESFAAGIKLDERSTGTGTDSLAAALSGSTRNATADQDSKSAYEAYCKDQREAWKNPSGRAAA